jgi:hypothetical protein
MAYHAPNAHADYDYPQVVAPGGLHPVEPQQQYAKEIWGQQQQYATQPQPQPQENASRKIGGMKPWVF